MSCGHQWQGVCMCVIYSGGQAHIPLFVGLGGWDDYIFSKTILGYRWSVYDLLQGYHFREKSGKIVK